MKVLALVFALAVFGASAAPQGDGSDVAADVTEIINNILEKIPEPAVDLHDKEITFDLVVEKIQLLLDDLVIKGIKALEIKQMDYDDSTGRLDYDLTIADVDFAFDFELLLSGLINLEHHPEIDFTLADLKLAGYAVVDTDASPHQVTDFKVLVSVSGATVDLSNILNDSELTESLNTVLNANLATMINKIATALEPIVSPIAQSVINIVIRHT